MNPSGIFEPREFQPYIDEGANWRYFQRTLGLCIEEGLPGKFLDVGSGLGYFVECCTRFGIPCEGLEGSEFAVQHATSRGIRVTQFDLSREEPFPFPSEDFSVILLSQVIEHLPKPAAANVLRESHRCLIRDGAAIILSPSKNNPKERLDPAHINLHSPSEMRQIIEECGFELIRYLNNWPRNVFTDWKLEYFFWRQVCRFATPDWLSQGASLVARKV